MNAAEENKVRTILKEQVDELRRENKERLADYDRVLDERRRARDQSLKHLDECVDNLREESRQRFSKLEKLVWGAIGTGVLIFLETTFSILNLRVGTS